MVPAKPPKKSITAMAPRKKALRNWARKNMANVMPEYSMWKPAINSDSASSKSKGVCSASANAEMK